jgi:multimeric flavodoxin WrbA
MRDAGASVELVYVKRLDIKPCTGELSCWRSKKGKCYIKDDMQQLYSKLRRADILVLATPVYIPLPGEMQNFINRLVALMDPVEVMRAGRTRVRFHNDVGINKVVLVSTSGWWEKANFRTVIRIAKEIAEDASVEFSGAIIRPHSDLWGEDEGRTMEVLEAVKQAGYHLVKTGNIPDALIRKISQPLISRKERIRRLKEKQ